MNRNTHFDFNRRLGESYWGKDKHDGVERLYNDVFVHWTAETVSSQGAHYHFWIEPNLSKEDMNKRLEQCMRAARDLGDPVRFSYDFIPTKGEI